MMTDQTIAAIATGAGTAGIGIVRISGTEAITVAEKMFRPYGGKKLSKAKGYSGMLGRIFDGGGDIDEAIIFVYRAPKTYTGEDVVELSCHGGVWLLQKVLRLCLDNGAVPAGPGEFTKRAFLNGKLDLIQAEAIMNLIGAQGRAAGKAALAAHDGFFSLRIREITDLLTAQSAHLSAWSDYPDEDIEPVDREQLCMVLQTANQKLEKLLRTSDVGCIIHEGVRTVIAGKPNVGKSSVMNMLSATEKSIVTEVEGTTRDVIEETVRVGDFVLRLADTAGIRDTDDIIETIGVKKTMETIASAQIVMAIFDISRPLSDWDYKLMHILAGHENTKVIAVLNKTDLPEACQTEKIKCFFPEPIYISAETGAGREKLIEAITQAAGMRNFDFSEPVVAGERQRLCLIQARDALADAIAALQSGMTLDAVNVDLDLSLDALLVLTGERVSERVLDEVFSRFCVGK